MRQTCPKTIQPSRSQRPNTTSLAQPNHPKITPSTHTTLLKHRQSRLHTQRVLSRSNQSIINTLTTQGFKRQPHSQFRRHLTNRKHISLRRNTRPLLTRLLTTNTSHLNSTIQNSRRPITKNRHRHRLIRLHILRRTSKRTTLTSPLSHTKYTLRRQVQVPNLSRPSHTNKRLRLNVSSHHMNINTRTIRSRNIRQTRRLNQKQSQQTIKIIRPIRLHNRPHNRRHYNSPITQRISHVRHRNIIIRLTGTRRVTPSRPHQPPRRQHPRNPRTTLTFPSRPLLRLTHLTRITNRRLLHLTRINGHNLGNLIHNLRPILRISRTLTNHGTNRRLNPQRKLNRSVIHTQLRTRNSINPINP